MLVAVSFEVSSELRTAVCTYVLRVAVLDEPAVQLCCMYVCMYRGRPSWKCPWKGAVQLGQGEGPIGIVGLISQPRGIIDTASRTLQRTSTLLCVFRGNFYSRQLRAICILMNRGALLHQAWYVCMCIVRTYTEWTVNRNGMCMCWNGACLTTAKFV